MRELFRQRNILRGKLFLLLGICLCVYFSFHAVQGQRSITRLLSVENQIVKQGSDLAALTDKRAALQERVSMMRPDSINKDLLEERVRDVLGYKHADEWVVRDRS